MDSTALLRPPAFTGQTGGRVSTVARRGLLQGVHQHHVGSWCSSELRPGRVLAAGADFECGSERRLGVRFGSGRLARRSVGHRLGAVLADGVDFGCGPGHGLGAKMAFGRVERPGADFGRELAGRGHFGFAAGTRLAGGGNREAHATSRR